MPDQAETAPIASKTQIALALTGTVGGQRAVVSLKDIEGFARGAEEFRLAIPPTGVSIMMQTVLDFLAKELKFDASSLPKNVLTLISGMKVTLYEFRYRRPLSEFKDGEWKPKLDSSDNPDPGDFRVSIEVGFSATTEQGGLLSALIGVDVSSVLDISSVRFTLSQGIFPEDVPRSGKVVSPSELQGGEPEEAEEQ